MEDCCIVCAEPLQWVAYGTCGHKDACSKCVARLRFVLKDNRCVICQRALQLVFVTKFLGDYTRALASAEFASLQEGSEKSVSFLKSIEAFFDDRGHYEEIRKLCSYTHPVLTQAVGPAGQPGQPRSLAALKKALQLQHHLYFCDLCLEGRKVFIPEQILYSKADLARHQRIGDAEGVLAESGFAGHPLCRFCNQRFFGETELFFHMQQAHEQCHICKKAHPDRFQYFHSYNELEEHFRHEHFLCGHPSCLEKKFMVFPSEQELKQHTAREHAGSMSRAERRQALTIPVDIQYSRRLPEETRLRGRRGGQPLREPNPAHLATALQIDRDTLQASLDTASRDAARQQSEASQQGNPRQQVLEDADFPSIAGPGSARFSAAGYSTAAAPGGRAKARMSDEFPALPGASQAAKQSAKQKAARQQASTLAERVGRPGEVRVLSSGRQSAQASRREEAFPALSSSNSGSKDSRAAALAEEWQAASRRQPTAAVQNSTAAELPALADFPSLPRSDVSARTAAPRSAREAAATGTGSKREDFPALGRGQASDPVPAPSVARAPLDESKPSGRGISEGLKAANKALIEKIRRQLDPKKFADFRMEAGRFMNNELDAAAYYHQVASLGLSHLIPEMAALLPDALKRAELLSLHESTPTSSGRSPAMNGGSAHLMAARVQSSWRCPSCTLINEPRAGLCEVCQTKRPMHDLALLSKGRSSSANSSAEPAAEKQGGKPKKVPKFERLRLTSGGRAAATSENVSGVRTKPGNAWTQRHNLAGAQVPASSSSAWGSQLGSSGPANHNGRT